MEKLLTIWSNSDQLQATRGIFEKLLTIRSHSGKLLVIPGKSVKFGGTRGNLDN